MPTPPATLLGEERARAAARRIGNVISDKWTLERLLAVGSMAAVYEARHANGNRVAIKILHADLTSQPELRERFLAEGYAANRVAHPGTVTVRDEGTTHDGSVFLVMDLLRGETLAQRLRRGRPKPREVLDIANQLLDVLGSAHNRGIVHRDIKPENIFLTREGRVRLLDFGIERELAHAPASPARPGAPGAGCAFRSPEQSQGPGAEVDGRSDLWALGATLFVALSAQNVYAEGSESSAEQPARKPRSLGAVTALPRRVVAVVDRALALDPDERFPDARSMQLAVRAALVDHLTPDPRSATPAMPFEPPPPTPRLTDVDQASVPTFRPVAAVSGRISAKRPSALERMVLPLFAVMGFAVGLGIVMLANDHVRPGPNMPTARVPSPRPVTAAQPEAQAQTKHLPAQSASAATSASASMQGSVASPSASPGSSTGTRAALPRRRPAERSPVGAPNRSP